MFALQQVYYRKISANVNIYFIVTSTCNLNQNSDDVKQAARCRFSRRWKDWPVTSQWTAVGSASAVVGGYTSTARADGGTNKEAQTDGYNRFQSFSLCKKEDTLTGSKQFNWMFPARYALRWCKSSAL